MLLLPVCAMSTVNCTLPPPDDMQAQARAHMHANGDAPPSYTAATALTPSTPADAAAGQSQPIKARKPYTIQKQRELWSPEEHIQFEQLLKSEGRNWKRMAELISSKSVVQIRSHAQKYFLKLDKAGNHSEIPPARSKRPANRPYPKSRPGTNKAISYSWNANHEQQTAAAAAAAALAAQTTQNAQWNAQAAMAAHAVLPAAVPAAVPVSSLPLASFVPNPALFPAIPATVMPPLQPHALHAMHHSYQQQQQPHAATVAQNQPHTEQQEPSSPAAALDATGDLTDDEPDDDGTDADVSPPRSDKKKTVSSLSLLSSVSSALPPASPLQKAQARQRAEATRALRHRASYPMPPIGPTSSPLVHSMQPHSHALATPLPATNPSGYTLSLSTPASAGPTFQPFAHTPMISPAAPRSANNASLFQTPAFMSSAGSGSLSGDSGSGHAANFSFSSGKKLLSGNRSAEEEEGKAEELPGRLNFDDAALDAADNATGTVRLDERNRDKRKRSAGELELWSSDAAAHADQHDSMAATAASSQLASGTQHAHKRHRLSGDSPHQLHASSPFTFLTDDAGSTVKSEPRSASTQPPFGMYQTQAGSVRSDSHAGDGSTSMRGSSVDWSASEHGASSSATYARISETSVDTVAAGRHQRKSAAHTLGAPSDLHHSLGHAPSSPSPASFDDASASAHLLHPFGVPPAVAFSPLPFAEAHSHAAAASATSAALVSGTMRVHEEHKQSDGPTSSDTLTPLKPRSSAAAGSSSFFSPGSSLLSPFNPNSASVALHGSLHLFSPPTHAPPTQAPNAFALATPREFMHAHTPEGKKSAPTQPDFSPVQAPTFY